MIEKSLRPALGICFEKFQQVLASNRTVGIVVRRMLFSVRISGNSLMNVPVVLSSTSCFSVCSYCSGDFSTVMLVSSLQYFLPMKACI